MLRYVTKTNGHSQHLSLAGSTAEFDLLLDLKRLQVSMGIESRIDHWQTETLWAYMETFLPNFSFLYGEFGKPKSAKLQHQIGSISEDIGFRTLTKA